MSSKKYLKPLFHTLKIAFTALKKAKHSSAKPFMNMVPTLGFES